MESTFTFWIAIELLRSGAMLARLGWHGDHQISLQVPTEQSKMTLPYIYITTQEWEEVPWVASQTDILATDWYEVK